MTSREKAHQLLDALPDSEVEPVLEFIASRGGDSFSRWLDSRPLDEEPLTSTEETALRESDEDLAAGRLVSHEDVKRELGIE